MSEYTDKKNKEFSSNIANENFYSYQFNKNLFTDEEKEQLRLKSHLKHILIFGDDKELKEFCTTNDINKIDNVLSFIFQSGRTEVLKYITKPIIDFSFNNFINGSYYCDTLNGKQLKLKERNWFLYKILFNKERYNMCLLERYDAKIDKKINQIENDFYKKLESQNINLNTRLKFNLFDYSYDTKILDIILISELQNNEKNFTNHYLIKNQLDIVNWDMRSRCETLAVLINIGCFNEKTKNPIVKKIIEHIDVQSIDLSYDFNQDVKIEFNNLEEILNSQYDLLNDLNIDFSKSKVDVPKIRLFDTIISNKSGITSKILNKKIDEYLSSIDNQEQKRIVKNIIKYGLDLEYNTENSLDSFYIRKILNNLNDDNKQIVINEIASSDIKNLSYLTEYNNVKINKKFLKEILSINNYEKIKDIVSFYDDNIVNEIQRFYKKIDTNLNYKDYEQKVKIFLEVLNDLDKKTPIKKRKM